MARTLQISGVRDRRRSESPGQSICHIKESGSNWINTSFKTSKIKQTPNQNNQSKRHSETYNKFQSWQIEFKLVVFQVNHVRIV